MEYNNVFLYFSDELPLSIKAFICRDNDENYNILVNKKLTHGEQEVAIMHELRHLINKDLDNFKNIYEIED